MAQRFTDEQFNTIKSIASELDHAARRAHRANTTPASRKQVFFLATLLFERDMDAASIGYACSNQNVILSTRTASNEIDNLLNPVDLSA